MHKFEDLPISIETFASYLDGALPREEMSTIGKLIEKDNRLRAILDTSDYVDACIEHYSNNDEITEIDNIEIPDFENCQLEDLLNGTDSYWNENVESFLKEEESLLASGSIDTQEIEPLINENEIINSFVMKELKTYGYEPNYELDKFDPNIFQGYNNTCAIRSQQIVLRDYGIMIPQEELMKYATDKGWFDPDPENGGTESQFTGNLLDDCGIETIRTKDATIYDIIAELRAGHRVMVAVDADELWLKKEPNLFKRLFQDLVNHGRDYIQDAANIEGANHALIVAGVNVNPSDPSDIHVTLIDTGTGEMCVEYTFKEFDEAWKDSHHFMVATTIPAPYQYNSETHQMEPSGFETDYIPSTHEIPYELQNTFKLSDSYFESYEDCTAEYSDTSLIPYEKPEPEDSGSNKDYSSIEPEDSGSNKDYSSIEPEDSGSNKDYSSIEPEDSGSNEDYSSIEPEDSGSNKDYSSIEPEDSGSNEDSSSYDNGDSSYEDSDFGMNEDF